MSNIDLLNNGDTGLQARTIINALVNKVNTSGASIPVGGTSGQILSKIDGTDYNTEWVDAPTGGSGTGTSGTSGSDGLGLNFVGGWLSDSPYGINDIVQYGNPYVVYIATDAIGIGESNPSINSKWSILVQSGTSGTTGPAGPAGPAGSSGSSFPYTGTAGITGSLNLTGISNNENAFIPTFSVKNSIGDSLIEVFNADVFIGESAGGSTSGYGFGNIAIGNYSLGSNTSGNYNVAIGESSLGLNTTGYYNTAIGQYALSSNTDGVYNTVIGQSALQSKVAGNYNIAIGAEAGLYSNGTSGYLTESSESIYIGSSASASSDNVSNEIVIGANSYGKGSNTITLGNITTETLYLGGSISTGIVIASPNGTYYRISVANDGTLTTTAI